MKMFVFDDVLHDYTSEMCMIVAESLEQAQRLAFERYAHSWRKQTFEEFRDESGFGSCQGEYEVQGWTLGSNTTYMVGVDPLSG